MIERLKYLQKVKKALNRSQVTALLGSRQVGKSTLARIITEKFKASYFDLEDANDLQRIENPQTTLGNLNGVVVIDEIQRRPELFPFLRIMADRLPLPAKFLILGSASPHLVKETSESLAGRIEFVELGALNIGEVGTDNWRRCWVRGGMPRSYLADNESDSAAWRDNFISTFLERDIPQLGYAIPSITMRRFWMMLAHYHGQKWNAAELGRSLGLNDRTMRGYLDILTGTFVVRQLLPWFENAGKRQVKSPKIYLRDSGLLHTLLRLVDEHDITGHPKCGASWEGFALEQVMALTGSKDAYFWSEHGGAELDLFIHARGKKWGFEFKYSDSPGTRRSMHTAIEVLNLEHLWIIYPGDKTYPLTDKITAAGLISLPDLLLKNDLAT